jgi:hypothetical protein
VPGFSVAEGGRPIGLIKFFGFFHAPLAPSLNLLTLCKGSARIHDLGRLKELAGYQGGYLNSDTKLLARH